MRILREQAGAPGGGSPTPPAPATTPAAPTPPVTAPSPSEPGPVPYGRFKEVNDELSARKKADEDRDAKVLADRGEHEKIAAREKEKREASDARALRIARRAAFLSAAAGQVADVEAAFKLANADGLLEALDVDEDGVPKDPKAVAAAVKAITTSYPFLKGQGAPIRDFNGDPRNGQEPGAPVDPDKLSPLEKMMHGIPAGGGRSRT